MRAQEEPSKEFIEYICSLYGDIYDDRIEDCRPPAAGEEFRNPGEDWKPGQAADHKSLGAFQKQLKAMGIELSTSKIRKILITGGCWTTERSREIRELFDLYTSAELDGGKGLADDVAVRKIAEELEVSIVTVNVNLPYLNVVYKLEKRSQNAVRCARYKKRRQSNLKQAVPARIRNTKKDGDPDER